MQLRHRLFLVALIETALLGCSAVAEQPCLLLSKPAELTRAQSSLPFRVGYGGPFPETSQGASINAYLDQERVTRLMTFEYLAESGRAFVVLRFQGASTYSIGVERYRYSRSVYDDPKSIEETLIESECFEVRDGAVVDPPPGTDTEVADTMIADLQLVLAEYMPCELKFPTTPSAPQPAPRKNR